MVAFAPTVPNPNVAATSDPEYTSYRWSRPIAPFEGNKATAVTIEGGAKALTEDVNAADTLVKTHIEHGLEAEGTALRDARTTALENTLAKVQAVNNPTPTNVDNAKKLDILGGPPKDDQVPSEIKGLSKALESEISRRDNGSVSDSYYKGKVAMLAKKYRSDWPGYTKEIDETIDRVTERGVANDYIRSMTTDLNKYAEDAKAQRNKYEAVAIEGSKNIPGFDQVAAMWKQGQLTDDQMMHKYNMSMAFEYNKKVAESKVAIAEANTKLAGLAMTDYAKAAISSPIKSAISMVGTTFDRKGGLDGIVADVKANKLDPAAGVQLGLGLTATRDQALMLARAEVQKNPKYKDLPEGALEKLIQDDPDVRNLNSVISLLTGKENSLAVLALQQSKAQAENDKWLAVSDNSEVGHALRGLEMVKDIGDPATRKLLESYTGDFTGLPDFVRKVQTISATQSLGPAAPEDKDVHTFKDKMDELIKNGAKDPEVVHHLIDDSMEKIVDPKVPVGVKLGFMETMFNKKNLGNSDTFEDDHRDPKTGNMVPGKFWFHRRVTDDAVASEVDRVATVMNRPKLRDQYSEYVAKESQALISGIVPELEKLFNNPYTSVTYDTEHQQIKIINTNYKFQAGAGNSLVNDLYQYHQSGAAKDIESKVNTVLSSMASMSRVNKQDPNANAYQLLSTMLPPNSKLLAAIQASAIKPTGTED